MKNLWDIKIVILKFAENRNLRSGFISNDDIQIGFKETECERRECGDQSVRQLDLTKVSMKIHIIQEAVCLCHMIKY